MASNGTSRNGGNAALSIEESVIDVWGHFCAVLELEQDEVKLLKDARIKSPRVFLASGEGAGLKEGMEIDAVTECLFKHIEGHFSFGKRSQLGYAWIWLKDNKEAVLKAGASEFCARFDNTFQAQVFDRANKRKAQELVQQDEKRLRKEIETKSSRLSASSFTSDSKHVLEGVGTMPPLPYKHMMPSHVQEQYLKLVCSNDKTIDDIKKIQTFLMDKGDGYTMKLMGETETTGARPIQEIILDGLWETKVFGKRVTTKRKFSDGLGKKR